MLARCTQPRQAGVRIQRLGSWSWGLDSFQSAALQRYRRRPLISIAGRGEAGKIVGKYFDVFFREQLGRRGHVPVEIGPGPCLEAAQLRSQIGELLPREPRDVLQAEKRRPVALHAVILLGEATSRRRVLPCGLVRRGCGSLSGEVRGKLVHVRVGEAGGDRRHLRILAIALAKKEKLHRDELRRLTGERRQGRVGRVPAGAVADGADLGLRWNFLGSGSGAGGEKRKRGGKHRRRAAVTVHFVP